VKPKKYNYGGKMEEEGGQMIKVMAPSLSEAVKQIEAAVSKSTTKPSHYMVKACFYEGEEE
jgi:hypothetical protein